MSGQTMENSVPWRAKASLWSYRFARVAVLALLAVIAMEPVTAIREICYVAALLGVLGYHLLSPRRFANPTAIFWPFMAYGAFCLLSLAFAVDPAYTAGELRAELVKSLAFYYLGVHFVLDREELGLAWGALLAGAALMVLAGLPLFFYYGGSSCQYLVRAGSLHAGYGGLGTYLVTVWPFILLAPRFLGRARLRPAWYVFIALTLLLAYLTYSRVVWITILAQGLFLAVLLSQKRLRLVLVGIGVLLVSGLLLFKLPGGVHGEKFQALATNPAKVGGTTGDLIKLWRFSYNHLAENPFRPLGLGRSSFKKAYPEFVKRNSPMLWHAHNMFVDMALQLGIQGLIAFLVLLAVLTACLWPHSPPPAGDGPRLFMTATLVMIAGFCLRNLADDFFVDDSANLFWLLTGLAMGARRLITKEAAP